MRKDYNKLVRDKMPSIIQSDGYGASYRILNDEEFIAALKAKIVEEADEVLSATDLESLCEEIADILTVIHTLTWHLEIHDDVMDAYRAKKDERGGFDRKLFLEKIY